MHKKQLIDAMRVKYPDGVYLTAKGLEQLIEFFWGHGEEWGKKVAAAKAAESAEFEDEDTQHSRSSRSSMSEFEKIFGKDYRNLFR